MDSGFNLRLIPLFDSARLMVEWMEKAELACRLCNVKWLEYIILLRLTGGAFAIYLQLRDEEKEDADKIKTYNAAFAMWMSLQHMSNS